MKLPAPRETLAGCIWLSRILTKARLLRRGELPPDYERRFCARDGVDGQFISFFALTKQDLIDWAALSDEEVIQNFLSRDPNFYSQVEKWNQIALNLGRPGYPMEQRLPVAKTTTYQHIDSKNMSTIFELLEADDKVS